MKILLFGKSGQVGWELQRSLSPLGELIALGSRGESWPCDFLHPQSLRETVRAVAPDVIVNAAAYTAVDKAESDTEAARAVNALAPAVLAQAAADGGALLVHYSTDYVFDGSGQRPWREGDPTGPLGAYARTKLEGERAVQQLAPRHLLFRTSWVYAARGQNFLRTMLRLAAEREQLSVVSDQIGAPTGAELIADVTAHAVRAVMADAAPGGTYHLAAGGETSWHGFARHIVEQAAVLGLPLKAAPDRVQAIPSSAWPTPAARPANSRLDTSRLREAFGLHLPAWQAGVDRVLAQLAGR